MATERIFDIQGFIGGESDDKYKGPANSFYSGENVEIRKDLSGAKLSSALVDTGWSISGGITCIVNLETLGVYNGGIVVATDSGNVYLDGTLKTTLNTGTAEHNRIRNIGVMTVSGTTYMYLFTGYAGATGKIHRASLDLNSLNTGAFPKSYTVASNSNQINKVSLIKDGDRIVFGVGNKVIEIDNTEVVTDLLTFPELEINAGLTLFQNNFKIYNNIIISGIQYVWNGSDTTPDYRQIWENQPILGIQNDGGIDYAVLGYNESYSDLYIISGTQKQEVRVNLEAASSSRVLYGFMSIREGILYISGGKSGESSNYGIYTYGNYYPGTPKSLIQEYSKSTSQFYGQCHSSVNSYFACVDGKVYKTEHNNPPSTLYYASSGYIVSPMYEGNIWEEKQLKKVKVGFKLESQSSIKIYARTEFGASWKLLKTIDYSTYNSKKGITIYENEFKSVALGNFNEIQFKIELTAGVDSGSNKYTPIIKRVTAFMDVINNG